MLTFIEFLKKYSDIPNTFIDDFYNIMDYRDYDSDKKIIEFEKVIKWLKINNRYAKKLLVKLYRINIDYNIKKINETIGSGGHNKKIYYLTINAFKKFCQSIHNEKGNEVRDYFIKVESVLNKYKNYIINGLTEKMDAIKKGRKPKVNPEKAIIYIFRTANTPENSIYKIGRTQDLTKRLHSHQSSLSEDIEILFYLETDDATSVESCIKTFAKEYQCKKYKEVYEVNIDFLKMLAVKCNNFKIDINQNKKLLDKDKKYFMNISKI